MNSSSLSELLALPLPLRSQAMARSLWAGTDRTRRRGSGGEFRELREYRSGDPLKQLDWRASARTDRWLVREMDRVAHLRIVIIIDGTESMSYGQGQGTGKLDWATTLAGALLVHGIRQGHAVSVWTSPDDLDKPRSGHATEHIMLDRLAVLKPTRAALRPPLELLVSNADVVCAIGDWLDEDACDLLTEYGLLTVRGVDVRALQLLHRDELDFAMRGPHELVPLEGPDVTPFRLDPRAVADEYHQAFQQHLDACRYTAGNMGVGWRTQSTDEMPYAALTFLATGVSI